MIPYYQTARHVTSKAAEVRTTLKEKIAAAVSRWPGAISIDGWLDKTKKVAFFGMTVHFMEERNGKFELNDRILCTREMDAETKDGAYIKSEIKKHLKSFDLYRLRKKFTFVSDRGSNMVSALRTYENIHCFAHMLNNTVQKMLASVEDHLKPVKALVKYFKVTGLNSGLDESLKSYVSTRWNSVFYMVKSVLANWVHIQEVLILSNQADRLDGIDEEFLKVFLRFIVVFSAQKYPSPFSFRFLLR